MMEEIKIKSRLGSLGDFETEYWTEEDWKKYREYCDSLRSKGELGKEVEHRVVYKRNPLFDDNTNESPTFSSRIVILDLNKLENDAKFDKQWPGR